jgi:8-oxo-dGTP pyrophosphatase MutT (NUDIX family)
MKSLAQTLMKRLNQPLPGWEAQIKAARALEHHDWRVAPNPYPCGLMLLLYPSQDELCVVFIKRPAYNDYFSKHVSFPGGGSRKSDENIIQTALRETKEELGVDPEAVTVLGQLSPLGFPPPLNMMIYPVVGVVPEKPVFVPDPREVEEVVEVPLQWFGEKEASTMAYVQLPLGDWADVDAFRVGDHIIWGGTAMILSELLTIMQEEALLPWKKSGRLAS